jgi:hypothetical protein
LIWLMQNIIISYQLFLWNSYLNLWIKRTTSWDYAQEKIICTWTQVDFQRKSWIWVRDVHYTLRTFMSNWNTRGPNIGLISSLGVLK